MKKAVNLTRLNAEVYEAAKRKGDISDAVNKMNFEEITAQITMLSTDKDYVGVMLGFVEPERFTGSVKELFWALSALEAAVIRAARLGSEEKSTLYNNYVNLLIIYVSNVYNPDLLNPDDIRFLPESHRFGYYLSEANKKLENGDKAGYLKMLKAALSKRKNMADVVKVLMVENT